MDEQYEYARFMYVVFNPMSEMKANKVRQEKEIKVPKICKETRKEKMKEEKNIEMFPKLHVFYISI